MNKFDFRNLSKLIGFDFKNNRKFIIGWSITIFSVMFLYMILFPSMQDMAKVKMDAMPKELLEFMGMSSFSEMNNFISYFGMVYNIILIAISIFAGVFSANLLYKEEKTKSIEFLYSLNVSRSEIYFSKLVVAFIGVIIVIMSAAISTFICGNINGGETFVIMDFIQIVKVSSFTAFFFISTSMFINGITGKISGSIVGTFVVLVSYMLGYLGGLLGDKGKVILYLSPFQLFNPTNALKLSNTTALQLMVYFIVMVCFIIIGSIVYKRRDYI